VSQVLPQDQLALLRPDLLRQTLNIMAGYLCVDGIYDEVLFPMNNEYGPLNKLGLIGLSRADVEL
jgi:hypothetical protein